MFSLVNLRGIDLFSEFFFPFLKTERSRFEFYCVIVYNFCQSVWTSCFVSLCRVC